MLSPVILVKFLIYCPYKSINYPLTRGSLRAGPYISYIRACQSIIEPHSPGSSSWPLPLPAPLWGFPPSQRGACTTPSLQTSHPSEVPATRGWRTRLRHKAEDRGKGGGGRQTERTEEEGVPHLIRQLPERRTTTRKTL